MRSLSLVVVCTLALTMLFTHGVILAADPVVTKTDFEKTQVGQVPTGWTVAKTGTGDGSVWSVVEDATAPKGAKVLAQTAESPNAVFNLCVVDRTQYADVQISVAFKAVKGNKDQGGGVVWRYIDANNYYIARYNPLEDNYRLYHIVAGKRTQIGAKENLVAKAGVWHTLSIKMVGDSITCSLNGQVQIEVKDKTFTKPGQVGLWTKADAHTYFDDFQAANP